MRQVVPIATRRRLWQRDQVNRLAVLAFAALGLVWGPGFPLRKFVLREVQPAHMVLLRFAVSTSVALPSRWQVRALFRSPPVKLFRSEAVVRQLGSQSPGAEPLCQRFGPLPNLA